MKHLLTLSLLAALTAPAHAGEFVLHLRIGQHHRLAASPDARVSVGAPELVTLRRVTDPSGKDLTVELTAARPGRTEVLIQESGQMRGYAIEISEPTRTH